MECYIASKIKIDFALKNAENRKFHPLLFLFYHFPDPFMAITWGCGAPFSNTHGIYGTNQSLGEASRPVYRSVAV